jgi:glycosyltransferase involved in cell wall biosynthesis
MMISAGTELTHDAQLAHLPLISCICITRGKPKMLNRAITCFESQTYPNKELILIYEDDDEVTIRWFEEQAISSRHRLIQVSATPKRTLGWLRNRAINEAVGEFVCQWDDDDWYHRARLAQQWLALFEAGHNACVVRQWILYDAQQQIAFISPCRHWEGSIFLQKRNRGKASLS